MLRSCVSPRASEEISYFLREGSLGCPRLVRTGNLDIPELSASFSGPSMAKSSLPSMGSDAN